MKSEQKRSNSRSSIHIDWFYYEFMGVAIIQTWWSYKENLQTCVDEINSKIEE